MLISSFQLLVIADESNCFVQRPPPVMDALGRVISESPPDQWEARYGI